MTKDKGFKRLARTRRTRTGESYALARQRLLAKTHEEARVSAIKLSAVDVSEWGFRVCVPEGWARVTPDTSHAEVLRVLAPPAAKPFFTVNKWGLLPNMDLDEYERGSLKALGPQAQVIRHSRTTIGGLPAFRTDYTGTHSMTIDAMLSIRAYGLIQPPVGWVFRFCTDDIARDAPVFDAIMETIQVT